MPVSSLLHQYARYFGNRFGIGKKNIPFLFFVVVANCTNFALCARELKSNFGNGSNISVQTLFYSSLLCVSDFIYVYIGFKTFIYVVRQLDSIASYLPTDLHLGFFRSWPSLFLPSSFSSVFCFGIHFIAILGSLSSAIL